MKTITSFDILISVKSKDPNNLDNWEYILFCTVSNFMKRGLKQRSVTFAFNPDVFHRLQKDIFLLETCSFYGSLL